MTQAALRAHMRPDARPSSQDALDRVIRAAWERPFYREHWRAHLGVTRCEQVLALVREGRMNELPVVRKSHLRDGRHDLLSYPGAVEIVSSSGTTGRPVDIPIVGEEERSQVARVQRIMRELGVGPGTRVLQMLSLNDLFSAGPLAWQAAKAEGACVIRCTTERAGRVLQVLEHLQPDVVVGNPIALIRLAETLADAWPAPSALPTRAFLVGAATFDKDLASTPIADRIAGLWGLELWLSSYGASDVGPVAYECRHHQGLHLHDDIQSVELIDPRTGAPIESPDTPGEIVVTALTLPRGFIQVRYATGDMAAWMRTEPCACGRTSARLGPIIGRINQHLKVVGQTVFPELLLDLADRCPGVMRSAVVVRTGRLDDDDVTVLILPQQGHDPCETRNQVVAEYRRHLATAPTVEVAGEADLAALEASASRHANNVKVPRFFDLRTK
ncbi:phenylacetate--CoA ligase family protein [Haliangium sp.]|uniref:phenylacetate--CoA ligase family protein n=1 Tax=Haliangium sp. TaxID=2663208 RepID=UPI003D0D5AAE